MTRLTQLQPITIMTFRSAKKLQVNTMITSGAGGARTHDRRSMSPRSYRSDRSASVLTWASVPTRPPVHAGELQPELQPRQSGWALAGSAQRAGIWAYA